MTEYCEALEDTIAESLKYLEGVEVKVKYELLLEDKTIDIHLDLQQTSAQERKEIIEQIKTMREQLSSYICLALKTISVLDALESEFNKNEYDNKRASPVFDRNF